MIIKQETTTATVQGQSYKEALREEMSQLEFTFKMQNSNTTRCDKCTLATVLH